MSLIIEYIRATIQESIILLEGRLEDAQKKYPYVPEQYWDLFVENDPSGNLKYLDWMVRNSGFVKTDAEYSLDIVFNAVKMFHANSHKYPKKDIYAYNAEELYLTGKEVEKKVSERQKKKEIKKNTIKLYGNDDWHVVIPTAHGASCYYGAGTKWCIASKSEPSHWEGYAEQGIEFIFAINKNKPKDDPMHKIAFAVYPDERCEVFNAEDKQIYQGDASKAFSQFLPPQISKGLWNKFSDNKKKRLEGTYKEFMARIKEDPSSVSIKDQQEHNAIEKMLSVSDISLEDYRALKNTNMHHEFMPSLKRNPNISDDALMEMNYDGVVNFWVHPSASDKLKMETLQAELDDDPYYNLKDRIHNANKLYNNSGDEFIDFISKNLVYQTRAGQGSVRVPVIASADQYQLTDNGYKNLRRLFINMPDHEWAFLYYEFSIGIMYGFVDFELIENIDKLSPEKQEWLRNNMLGNYANYEKFASLMEPRLEDLIGTPWERYARLYKEYMEAKESRIVNIRLGRNLLRAVEHLKELGKM